MADRETWAEQRERLEGMASGFCARPPAIEDRPAIRAALNRIDAFEAELTRLNGVLREQRAELQSLAALGKNAPARLAAAEAVVEAARAYADSGGSDASDEYYTFYDALERFDALRKELRGG